MPAIDMTEILKPYEDKWVALTDDNKVVGSGDTLEEASKEAKKNGYDDPIFMIVPSFKYGFAI